ncbi:hypothetical protein U1Q18_041053 [Sarracenia purpurea var. burkii]
MPKIIPIQSSPLKNFRICFSQIFRRLLRPVLIVFFALHLCNSGSFWLHRITNLPKLLLLPPMISPVSFLAPATSPEEEIGRTAGPSLVEETSSPPPELLHALLTPVAPSLSGNPLVQPRRNPLLGQKNPLCCTEKEQPFVQSAKEQASDFPCVLLLRNCQK